MSNVKRYMPEYEPGCYDYPPNNYMLECPQGDWVSHSDYAALEASLAKVEAERDEADRRAGAAQREMVELKDSKQRRSQWLDKAKEERGYRSNASFDVVWKETCDKADQVARLRALKDALAGDKINLVSELRQVKAELATARRDALEDVLNRLEAKRKANPQSDGQYSNAAHIVRHLLAQEEPTT